MTTSFARESSYIVIKRSDIAAYSEDTKKLVEALPQRNAVVVEADSLVDNGGVLSNPEGSQAQVQALVREIHQVVKRGRSTQDHGLMGNLRCILDHVLPDTNPDTEPLATELRARGVAQESVACACGDFYPASSFGAGFIAATGHCENCEAAANAVSTVADSPVGKCGVSSKSEELQVPDECDSPVLCKLNRACAGQLGTKKQCGTHLQATRTPSIELVRQAGLVAVPNSKPIAVQGLFSELEALIKRVRNEAMDEAKQAVAALECPKDEDNFEAGCMYSMHVIDKLKS